MTARGKSVARNSELSVAAGGVPFYVGFTMGRR